MRGDLYFLRIRCLSPFFQLVESVKIIDNVGNFQKSILNKTKKKELISIDEIDQIIMDASTHRWFNRDKLALSKD